MRRFRCDDRHGPLVINKMLLHNGARAIHRGAAGKLFPKGGWKSFAFSGASNLDLVRMDSRMVWIAPPYLILACYHRFAKTYLPRIEGDTV
jgi:hypothetical protein